MDASPLPPESDYELAREAHLRGETETRKELEKALRRITLGAVLAEASWGEVKGLLYRCKMHSGKPFGGHSEAVLDVRGAGAGKRLDSSTLELVEVVFMLRNQHC